MKKREGRISRIAVTTLLGLTAAAAAQESPRPAPDVLVTEPAACVQSSFESCGGELLASVRSGRDDQRALSTYQTFAAKAPVVAASAPAVAEPAIRVFDSAAILASRGQMPAQDASRTKAHKKLVVCFTVDAAAAEKVGPLKLFADKKYFLGTMGYNRYYGCADLSGVSFTLKGARTIDVRKADRTWWASKTLRVE